MRLGDEIVRQAGVMAHTALGGDYSRFAASIRRAVPYVIDKDVGEMAGAVAHSDLERLVEALPYARLPFENVWIEWGGSSFQFGPPPYAAQLPGTHLPTRCGALFQVDATGQRGSIHLAWSMEDQRIGTVVSFSPIAVSFDWTDRPQAELPCILRSMRGMAERFGGLGPGSSDPWSSAIGVRTKTMTRAEIDRESARWGFLNSPMLDGLHGFIDAQVNQQLTVNANAGLEMLQRLLNDWAGEPKFLQALMIVLNSRNMVDIGAREDKAKLNADRARRSKQTFLEYHEVKVSLSQVARRAAASAGGQGMDMRAHLVRGHFKVRRTGVYWWAPFTRGNPTHGVVVRKGYEVHA